MKLKTLAIPAFVLMTSFASAANAGSNHCQECQPAPTNTNINTIGVNPTVNTDVVVGANLTSNVNAGANALSGSSSDASTGPIDIANGSSANVHTGATTQASLQNATLNAGDTTLNAGDTTLNAGDNTQTVGDTTQTVGDNTQTVGPTTQTVGDTNVAVGDTNQTTDASSASQGNNTVVGGQNVSYSNTTKVGAITGAPNMGSQMVVGECKEGFSLSLGGGNPFTGSYGAGISSTSKDDECIREGREHQKDLKQMSITHYEKIAVIKTNSNEIVARIQGATTIANTGMTHLCNIVPGAQTTSNPEHHACEANTTQAINFLFPVPAKPVVAASAPAPKAPGHKH